MTLIEEMPLIICRNDLEKNVCKNINYTIGLFPVFGSLHDSLSHV